MNMLDDLDLIKRLDQQDMYDKIIHLPEQVLKTYDNAKIHRLESPPVKISRLIICGMGGSAISGDIAKAAFEHLLPIEIVKNYDLPYCDENTLVITISYSGNTEETLSCLQQAMKAKTMIAAITSGGAMKQLIQNRYNWIEVEKGFPPRAAIARLFFSLLLLLEEFRIIPSQAEIVKRTAALLIKKAASICLAVPAAENLAKLAANQIKGKIPVIYSCDAALFSLACRWKCQINENAKYPAFCHTLPEMNHNEIEGWEEQLITKKLLPILLGNLHEKPRLQKRKEILKNLFSANEIEYLEFFAEGGSLIEKIFSLVYLGDMISYYVAILQNTDPTTIDFIDHLKTSLERT